LGSEGKVGYDQHFAHSIRPLMKASLRGFTLIELLVVIAIIAILAAILFPVFASAKAAAKATASISNAKQMATGFFLYNGDTDDRLPLAAYQVGEQLSIWHDLVDPYIKNKDVWHCPGSKVALTDANGTITSHWGYSVRNLTTFALDFSNANDHTAVSMSQIGSPSDTVLLVSAHTSVPGSWCGDDGKFLLLPTDESGDCWGRPDEFITERAVIAWTDGHANRKKNSQYYTDNKFFDLE